MKIAVANNNMIVTEHFGHCEGFYVVETDGKNIINSENIASPGHKPGFLPNYLADLGVNVIISGGIGKGAIDIFNERGVSVVVGATGEVQTAVEAYLAGSLKSSGSVCQKHEHHDQCGE